MSLQKIRKTTIERGVRMVSGSEGDLTALNAIPLVALKQKRDQEKQVLHSSMTDLPNTSIESSFSKVKTRNSYPNWKS